MWARWSTLVDTCLHRGFVISARARTAQDQSRLLPVLAVERVLRAVVLVGVGIILLTHTHTDSILPG